MKPVLCLVLLVVGMRAQNFNPTCVSLSAINAAFQNAQQNTGLTSISSDPSDYELGLLGKTLEATTRILAQQCNLTPRDVFAALPTVNTGATVINNLCPASFKPYPCTAKRYRNQDGTCNNLANPMWGAVNAPYRRLIPPMYADGIGAPRNSVTGSLLPPVRQISLQVHKNLGFIDQALTVHFVSWGQLIDHDMVETVPATDSTGAEPSCCSGSNTGPPCFPIFIAPNDPFYSAHGVSCLEFSRNPASPKPGCKLGVRDQFNGLTSLLDASFVYGNDDSVTNSLRSFTGGLLKTQDVFKSQGLKALSPLRTTDPDDDCFRTNTSTFCFLTGDMRSSQQPMLSVPHTIFMREHNRIATQLQLINPTWNDEKIFQETRHIVAAIVQKITYDEYLPILLGPGQMTKYGLSLLASGYFNGYDPTINPTLPNAFNTAAFRFGHSMVPGGVQRWSPTHQFIGMERFRDIFYQPWDLYKPGYVDQYLIGMMNQIAHKSDDAVTEELTNHLEQEPTDQFGSDLAARNIQRGRDHGIPSYNAFRTYCGLPPIQQWSDLVGVVKNETIAAFSQIYKTPQDIDFWSAGVSEFPMPGSVVGPTFNCIIGQTFQNLRRGDRFWFENGGWPSSFTPEQLAEIRKVKYARVICDNGDSLDTVQMNVMLLPDPVRNPRVSCKNSVLPSIDLTKWKQL